MQRWKTGSQAMVSVNAIFAGFSGVVAGALIATDDKCVWTQVSMALSLLSFVLFAGAAEKITDALDEENVHFYLRSMLAYNIAVVLLFFAVGVFLFARGYYLFRFPLGLIPLGGSIYWICDIFWLLFAKKNKRQEYIEDIRKKS